MLNAKSWLHIKTDPTEFQETDMQQCPVHYIPSFLDLAGDVSVGVLAKRLRVIHVGELADVVLNRDGGLHVQAFSGTYTDVRTYMHPCNTLILYLTS